MYKANRDKKEALAEKDNAVTEATRVKKMKEEAEKAMGEVVEAKNKLQSEVEGKCVYAVYWCVELKRVVTQNQREMEQFANQSKIFKETLEGLNTLNA